MNIGSISLSTNPNMNSPEADMDLTLQKADELVMSTSSSLMLEKRKQLREAKIREIQERTERMRAQMKKDIEKEREEYSKLTEAEKNDRIQNSIILRKRMSDIPLTKDEKKRIFSQHYYPKSN